MKNLLFLIVCVGVLLSCNKSNQHQAQNQYVSLTTLDEPPVPEPGPTTDPCFYENQDNVAWCQARLEERLMACAWIKDPVDRAFCMDLAYAAHEQCETDAYCYFVHCLGEVSPCTQTTFPLENP